MGGALVLALILLILGSGSALRLTLNAPYASVRARHPLMAYSKVIVDEDASKKKNPTAADRPGMSDKFAGLKQSERDTKKNARSRIMKKKTYKRGGNPFDRSIHREVSEKMSERFASELVAQMQEDDFREISVGDGVSQATFVLAKEFGFCWGVERSIELAWSAREAYPEKTMHLTNELIHNPGVNELLGGMDIQVSSPDRKP